MIISDCKDNRFAPYGGYPRRGFYYPDYGFSPPRAGMQASRRGFFGPPSLRPSLRPPPLACGCARTPGDIHVAPTFPALPVGRPVETVSRIENSISRPVISVSRPVVMPIPAAVVACVWSRPSAGRHECRPYVSRRFGRGDGKSCCPVRHFWHTGAKNARPVPQVGRGGA